MANSLYTKGKQHLIDGTTSLSLKISTNLNKRSGD